MLIKHADYLAILTHLEEIWKLLENNPSNLEPVKDRLTEIECLLSNE